MMTLFSEELFLENILLCYWPYNETVPITEACSQILLLEVSRSFLELTDGPFEPHRYGSAHFPSESQETRKTCTSGYRDNRTSGLGARPSMAKSKTINQGKGNRVISILYLCNSIFLNCLGTLHVKVRIRVFIFYV